MVKKTRVSKKLKEKLKDKKIRRVGIISALISGILLAVLAFLGLEVSAMPSPFLKVLPILLAFMFGAAIGGGVGVWVCELNQEEGRSY